MRPPIRWISMSLLATAACVLTSGVVARADEVEPTLALEHDMALLLDRTRVAHGLLPLARVESLDRAASAHARDMAAQRYMEHEAPDGSTPASRAADAGYQTPRGSAWMVVEVISARGDPAEHAVDWWLSDGLHRRVVLRPTWREMGIGFAPGGPYGRFWVVLFGCRPNVLPPVVLDGVLNIPDETCSSSPDAFGRVESVRVADSVVRLADAPWQPYQSQQEWLGAAAPVVQLRDATGRILEVEATSVEAGAR